MDKVKVYLASPLGFTEIGRKYYYEQLIPFLEKRDLKVLDPWTSTPVKKIRTVESMNYGIERREAWKELNREIGENNRKAIEECDCILAILDGTDVDSGVAAEIGYGFATGKKIVGYRGDFRLSSDNEGATVNLQVEYFIEQSGGKIASDLDKAVGLIKSRVL